MECSCNYCSSACTRKPGWFMPEEIEPLAKFLNLSLEECFKQFLAVDWWEGQGGDSNIFLLSPAITSSPPGTEFPGDPRGTCVFYKDGRCAIHPVKPHECRAYDHTVSTAVSSETHERIPEAWVRHQETIKKLLGREPLASEYQGPSVFELWSNL